MKYVNTDYADLALELINDKSVNINFADFFGMTPLFLAIQQNEYDLVIAIIETGRLDYEYVRIEKDALIHACSVFGINENIPLRLLETGRFNLNRTTKNGTNALIFSCMTNQSKVALEIIKTGKVDLSHKNDYGYTALAYACHNDMKEVALEIIKTRQNIESDKTAFYFACEYNLHEIAMALLDLDDEIVNYAHKNITSLMHACTNSNIELALRILATGRSRPFEIFTHFDGTQETAFDHVCNNNLIDVAIEMARMNIITFQDIQTRKPEWITSDMILSIENEVTDICI